MGNSIVESPYDLICKLERLGYHRGFVCSSVNVWPLIRQCVWLSLFQRASPRPRFHLLTSFFQKLYSFLRKPLDILFRHYQCAPSIGSESVAFFSLTVYLQNTCLNVFIDRIVDPLLHCLPSGIEFSKYYVSPVSISVPLRYHASLVKCSRRLGRDSLSAVQIQVLIEISEIINVPSVIIVQRCEDSLDLFFRWFSFGVQFFMCILWRMRHCFACMVQLQLLLQLGDLTP